MSESSTTLKSQNKKYVIWIITLVIINTVLFAAIPHDERSFNERLLLALQTFVIGTPILGFVFGALTAFLPYRNLRYAEKYLRASLLVMICFHVVMLAMSFITIIFFFINDGMPPR